MVGLRLSRLMQISQSKKQRLDSEDMLVKVRNAIGNLSKLKMRVLSALDDPVNKEHEIFLKRNLQDKPDMIKGMIEEYEQIWRTKVLDGRPVTAEVYI